MLEHYRVLRQQISSSQLVIFDFDGTLVNLEQLNFNALKVVTMKYLGQEVDVDKYRNISAGVPSAVGIKNMFEYIAKQESIKLDDYDYKNLSEEYRDVKRRALSETPAESSELVRGAEKLLPILRAMGKNIAICSASSHEFINRLLTYYGVRDYFEYIVASQDVTLGKPYSEPYDKVIDHFRIKRSYVTAFEDSRNGIRSAKAAGLFVIGVHNPGWNDNYVHNLADEVVEDYVEVLRAIGDL